MVLTRNLSGVSDPLLDAFEDAWRFLRTVVERVDGAPADERDAMRDELAGAIDQALSTRARAREALAARYGGDVEGDQVLWAREVQVGALSAEIDGFVEDWRQSGGGKALTADELLTRVRPLLVEPGDPEAQEP